MMRRAAMYGLLCCAGGCAARSPLQPSYVVAPAELARGGVVRITDSTGYLSYHAPTPKDFSNYRYLRRVRGEVCQNDLQLPLHLQGGHAQAAFNSAQSLQFLWGDATVASGITDAMNGAPQGAVLYDLALDLHHTSVFGIFFRRKCLVVSGSMAVPQPKGLEATPAHGGPTQAPLVPVPVPEPMPKTLPAPRDRSDNAAALPALEPLPKAGVKAAKPRTGHGTSKSRHHGHSTSRHSGHKRHTSGSSKRHTRD